MTTVCVADTGVFVRCGGPDSEKYRTLRHAVTGANASLLIPRRVYEELGGDDLRAYSLNPAGWQAGIEQGWIVVADELDYTSSVVSGVMDDARRFVASETDRDEDRVEKADIALVGLAAELLNIGKVSEVVLSPPTNLPEKRRKRCLQNMDFEIGSSTDT
jgi:hypothetical protein